MHCCSICGNVNVVAFCCGLNRGGPEGKTFNLSVCLQSKSHSLSHAVGRE